MYGPATEPPPQQRPRRGAEGAMRVLFASFPILSCGLLAWLPALRIALLRMGRRDWVVFAVVVALNAGYVTALLLVPVSDEEGASVPEALTGLYALGFIIGCVVHAMVAGRTPLPLTARYPGSAHPTAYPFPGGPRVPPGPAPSGPAPSGPAPSGAVPASPLPATPRPFGPGPSAPTPGPPAPSSGSAFSPPVVVSPVVSPAVGSPVVGPPAAEPPPATPVPRVQQVRSELDELGERLRQREQL